MGLLYLLEQIRLPGLNELMLAITYFGDEMAFLVLSLILFWCVDKKLGYYVLSVGFAGTIANQFLKLWYRIPRPWVLDPQFTIVEQARAGAAGYSFPSGHSQSAVGTFGALACTAKRRWLRTVSIVLAILVPFSRMYLGVHTPQDVLVGAAMAIVLVFALRPVVFGKGKANMPLLLLGMVLLAAGYLCYVELYPFPADIDAYNMHSGLQNAYTLLGAILGFLPVYFLDARYIHFETKAVWWAQILKVLVGLGLVLAVKSGLKAPLESLLGALPGRAARYFLMVIMAGTVWPLSFRWFSGLGKGRIAQCAEDGQ